MFAYAQLIGVHLSVKVAYFITSSIEMDAKKWQM